MKLKLAPRIGYSWFKDYETSMPLEANLLFVNKNNPKSFIELGLGTTFMFNHWYKLPPRVIVAAPAGYFGQNDRIRKDYNIFLSRVGFRHQNPEGGFMFRVGFNIIYNPKNFNHKIKPFGGLSIGYSF